MSRLLTVPPPTYHLPFSSSPWPWEWILLSRAGFLCPAGHSLSETHWCSPGQKHCWCSLYGQMERERKTEIRKSEGQTKLALWIIQHNPWEAPRSLWKGSVSISFNMDTAFALLSFFSLPACPPIPTCSQAASPASLCLICHFLPSFHCFYFFSITFPLYFFTGCMPGLPCMPGSIHIHWVYVLFYTVLITVQLSFRPWYHSQ